VILFNGNIWVRARKYFGRPQEKPMRASFILNLNSCPSFVTWTGVMQMKRAGALASAFLVIGISLGSVSLGMAKSTKDAGLGACLQWCTDHNKTASSVDVCVASCDAYYSKKKVGPMKVEPSSGKTINPNPGLHKEMPEGSSKKK
jgi:hypothetical protein